MKLPSLPRPVSLPHRRAVGRHGRAIAAGLAAVLAAISLQAQPVKAPRELRMASSAPPSSVWGKQAERWAEGVQRESQGQLKLRLFLGAQLGADTAVIQQVASRRIDMASVSLSSASVLAPELLVAALPMQYRSRADFDCVIDAGIGTLIAERLASKGLHVIAMSNVGTVQLIGRRAFRVPSDLVGMKAGTTGAKLGLQLWTALGASPVQINPAEVASAFQTGLVDVAPTTPSLYVSSGLNKLAPVLTVANLYQMPSLVVINKALWDSLSEAERVALERTRTPAAQLRQEVADSEEQAFAAHVQGGGQLVIPTPAQRELTRSLLTSHYAEMVAEAGPDGLRLHRRVEEARKACEKGG